MAKRKAKKVESKGFEAPNNILATLTGGVQQTLMVAALGLFVFAVAPTANALTFESGQVIVDGGTVANIEDTAFGKRQLEEKGYVISGGTLVLDVAGTAVSVRVSDLAGKSKEDQIAVIVEAAGDVEINGVPADAVDSAEHEAFVAQLREEGIEVPTTVEEAIDNASAGISQAIDASNAAIVEAVEAAASAAVNDPNGFNAEAIADGHTVYIGDPDGAPGTVK